MKLYATLLGILMTQVACLPIEIEPYTGILSIEDQLQSTNIRENMRSKRQLPIVGDILGRVGEVILGVGTGVLGLKAGIQHGVQAGHLLNRGDWGSVPGYDNGYYGPGYVNGYYGPGFGNGYYGPNFGNGYYGPDSGYGNYGPSYNNGYYSSGPYNRPGNNGGYGGGYRSSCRTPQGTPC